VSHMAKSNAPSASKKQIKPIAAKVAVVPKPKKGSKKR
jgi:hypothetical protein